MLRSLCLRRSALALLLLVSLAFTSAAPGAAEPSGPAAHQVQQVGHRHPHSRPQPSSVLDSLWRILTSLWGADGTSADPNGKPH